MAEGFYIKHLSRPTENVVFLKHVNELLEKFYFYIAVCIRPILYERVILGRLPAAKLCVIHNHRRLIELSIRAGKRSRVDVFTSGQASRTPQKASQTLAGNGKPF